MDYWETSALTGEGVEAMFQALATQIVRRVNSEGEKEEPKTLFALQSEDGREGCCA